MLFYMWILRRHVPYLVILRILTISCHEIEGGSCVCDNLERGFFETCIFSGLLSIPKLKGFASVKLFLILLPYPSDLTHLYLQDEVLSSCECSSVLPRFVAQIT